MTKTFDQACIDDIWGLPPDALYGDVLALVRAEAPRLCKAAADALAAGARADLQRHAHTLKGACANICAAALADLAAGLADAAPAEAPHALARRLAALVAEWQRVAAIIDVGGPVMGRTHG